MKTKARGKLLTGSILEEQIDTETQAVRAGVVRYRKLANEATKRGDGASLKPAERLLLYWYQPVRDMIAKDRRKAETGEYDTHIGVWGPPLRLIDADRLAVITLHEIVSRCMASGDDEGVPVASLAYSIGRAVVAEANLDAMKRTNRAALKELDRRCRNMSTSKVNWWAKKTLEDPIWNRSVCVHLGTRLIWVAIECCSINDGEKFELAFHHERVDEGKRTRAILRMDDKVFSVIEDGHVLRESMRPRYLPTIVQPYKWSKDAQGGYVKIRTPFISKPTRDQKEALAAADLTQVWDCLEAITKTAWSVNRYIHRQQIAVWENGGGELGIPPRDKIPMPPIVQSTDPEIIQDAKRERVRIYRQNLADTAARKEFCEKHAIAEQFKNRTFYYPHQLDFRGRVYPIPPHLNHQGDDVCRGLLQFAESRPISDYRWLSIHVANCYGMDKLSFDDRMACTNDSALWRSICVDNPLDYESWMMADKPWQFLAACRAMTNSDSAVRIPIQLDGTCNGLQHYCALGRDEAGASVVNMLPSDRPDDVYSNVAGVVKQMVDSDAALGDPLAVLLSPLITRKVVKQTVMTNVYGVTMVGARQQVQERLKEAGLTGDTLYDSSAYLSKVVIRAIGKVCSSATAIMDWLRECARHITASGHLVRWTTPLGLPVVQPYRKWRSVRIDTILGQLQFVNVDEEDIPVSPSRQCDGVAPNFIHSIDATHLMMTARACRDEEIAFAGVHDSYWTHVATVDRMGVILREEFVRLHEQPILENLAKEWRSIYPGVDIPDPPQPGTYNINTVKEATYFFN